ncbi:hypothetical protein JVT61DRAFT_2899 [Boletus reticuloceps]|uniref:Uncharacterized protein n=1 Tax=Boletus reticuloceps TaxID=495285 RepID=A0A8I2YN86_9AGAM|nr:hypothetical protein JVT61DRAFT_2899 [Boletus reticuloceps]
MNADDFHFLNEREQGHCTKRFCINGHSDCYQFKAAAYLSMNAEHLLNLACNIVAGLKLATPTLAMMKKVVKMELSLPYDKRETGKRLRRKPCRAAAEAWARQSVGIEIRLVADNRHPLGIPMRFEDAQGGMVNATTFLEEVAKKTLIKAVQEPSLKAEVSLAGRNIHFRKDGGQYILNEAVSGKVEFSKGLCILAQCSQPVCTMPKGNRSHGPH